MVNSSEKPKHLIFLDIDGVLRPDKAYDGKLQKKPIAHVRDIAHKLESRIVITSTWRDIHSWQTFNQPNIFNGLVIGETPDIDPLHGDNGRYKEVLAWLEQTGNQDVPWIALDDKRVHYPDLPNVYLTNPETGVDQATVDRILLGRVRTNELTVETNRVLKEVLGNDLHEKVCGYAAARNISAQTALRQFVRAGFLIITED